MAFYQEIKALEESIALTEQYLANCQREWDSLLVCYDDDGGAPYSAYCEQEDLEDLEMAINEHQTCLRRDRDNLMVLLYKQQLEMKEHEKVDEMKK
jgi:hypothetical protein